MSELANTKSRRILDDKSLADAALRMALLSGAGAESTDIVAAGAGPEWYFDRTGKDLDAILADTGLFPAYFTDMMSVGLSTGKLPECLKSLHDYYLRSHQLKQSVRQALYQPLSMLAISLLVVLVILVKIFPVFATAYESAGMPVGPAMAALLCVGAFISAHVWTCIAGVLVLSVIIFMSCRMKAVRDFVICLAARTKLGKAVRNAKLMQVFSMGLDSGMDMGEAMAMASDISGVDMQGSYDEICKSRLGFVLYDRGIVTESDRRILESGEKAGNLPDAAAYVAASMMDSANARIQAVSARIEPVITLIGAVMAGGIILLSMLPLLEAMSSIG